jgi:hypothetical protein
VLGHPTERSELELGGDPILSGGHQWRVGRNPYFFRPAIGEPRVAAWFTDDYLRDVLTFAQRSIDGFYSAMTAAEGRPQPAYFVEKFAPDQLSVIATSVYRAARELILVRDFRDVLASMIAFDDKRGVRSFGRERLDEREFVAEVARAVRRLARFAKDRANISLVVRYEDLVADPAEALARILGHVGLSSAPAVVQSMIQQASPGSEEMDMHRTASSPGESIGRWRRDLSTDLQEVANALLSDSLAAFGYAD